MELIIPLKREDFTHDGLRITDGKFVLELLYDSELKFHSIYKPFYANTIEGCPMTLYRLSKYLGAYDNMGGETLDPEIDVEVAINNFIEKRTLYAIGSQLHDDEDLPLIFKKNDKLTEDIILLKYCRDNDDITNTNIPEDIVDEANKKSPLNIYG